VTGFFIPDIRGMPLIVINYLYPWHPRLSEKLGLFRLVQIRGSHELCFTDPARLAQALVEAGRD
jgi:hypothetical protein